MNNPFFYKYFGVKSKSVGPFLAFNIDWFEKYQNILLFLVNFFPIKYWFRWILRINNDCNWSDLIISIGPDQYSVMGKDGQIKTDFRTHNKFSKRIYFAFRWWWWSLHYIDEFLKVLLPETPQVQFGFDTLTAYPAAGANSPVDGSAYWSSGIDDTYPNCLLKTGNNGGPSANYIMVDYCASLNTLNRFHELGCGFACFNTSTIGSMKVDSAILSGVFIDVTTTLGTQLIHVVESLQSSESNISTTDFMRVGNTSFGSINNNSITKDSGYHDFVLNSAGKTNINKTGVTKFGLISDWALNKSFAGTWIANVYNSTALYSADTAGTSSDPKLVVTFSASTQTDKKINGISVSSVKSYEGILIENIKNILGV